MRLFLLLLLSTSAVRLTAQTFMPLPGALFLREVAIDQANVCYIHFEDNNVVDSLHLKWRLAEISMPNGWSASLCDYGTCYTAVPPGKTMLPAPDTAQPYLKLVVLPNGIAGSAWVWFRVSRVGDDTDIQDVFYSLYTPNAVPVSTPVSSAAIEVFPNPATDHIYLKNQNDAPVSTLIRSAIGGVVWQGDIADMAQVSVAHWPSGLYLVQSGNKIQKLIIH